MIYTRTQNAQFRLLSFFAFVSLHVLALSERNSKAAKDGRRASTYNKMILCFRESGGTQLLRIGHYCNIIIRLFASTRLAQITHWAKYVPLCQARPRLLGEIKKQ